MKYAALESALNYRFAHLQLLQQALTHRSFSADNNERFEFLGDSILNMVIAMALFERFGTLKEGELSRLRSQLVNQDSLQKIALRLKVGELLRLGEGEVRSGGSSRPSILADAMEAIFGAIFLDSGFEAAEQVVTMLYADVLESLDPTRTLKDPKTALQEFLQSRHMPLPQYELIEVRGLAHAQEFEVECTMTGLKLQTRGVGQSRRIAEQIAAQNALQHIEEHHIT